MFPFCAFGLISIPFLLTLKPKTETLQEKLARIDWIGGLIFISSATLFLVAISWGGTQFAWGSVQTIVPLVLGTVGLIGTWAWERYGTPEPFLRHSLFKNASSCATYICGSIQGLVIFGQLYYIPFYFLSVRSFSPVDTGVALLPVAFTLIPGSIVTGILVTRLNNFRWPIWLGWVVLTIGCGLTLLFDINTSIATWAITLIVIGFGHGSILNAQNFASQAICNDGEEGAAAAMYGFMRHFGTALGVGIGGSVFQNVMTMKLTWVGLPTAIASNAEAFIPRLQAMANDDPVKISILDAYVFGFRGVYAFYLAISAVAFLISLLIKHHDLNKEIGTEQTLHDNRISRILDEKMKARVVGAATPESERSD